MNMCIYKLESIIYTKLIENDIGEKAIEQALAEMPPKARRNAEKMLTHIREGKRDVFC